jgi:hypothetical protein
MELLITAILKSQLVMQATALQLVVDVVNPNPHCYLSF